MIVLSPMLREPVPSTTARLRENFLRLAEPSPQAQLQSLVLATLAVTAGVVGALSTIPFSSVLLRSFLLMVLLVAGVGSAVLCWLELPTGAAVAGVVGVSVAAVIAVATSMVWLHMWHPIPSCLAMSFTVTAIGLIRLWTLREAANSEPMPVIAASDAIDVVAADVNTRVAGRVGRAAPHIAVVLLPAAFVTWLIALPQLRDDPGGQYGLVATPGGVLLVAATILAITAFFVAIVLRQNVIAGVAILVVIITERVTVPLITVIPNYAWTYKHIGLVDYIQQNGTLPSVAFDIYSPWPGFFTGMAWFSSITHLDLVSAASWFATVAATLTTVMVAALALGFGLGVRLALTAAMLAQVLNWVGQDYFSPQAIALILAVAALALLTHSRSSPVAGYLSLPVFAVLIPVHQLTPVWICGVAVGLALFSLMRPRWLAFPYLLLLGTYLFSRQSSIDRFGWLSSFNPVANSATVVKNRGSDGRVLTTLVEQGLSLSMWVLAVLCFVVIWRGAPRLTAGIIAFSPVLILFAQSYGGEAIFRVYLYSLAGCAVLLAGFLGRSLSMERPARDLPVVVAAWLAVIGFAVAGLQGYYGGWSYVRITERQLEQSREILADTPSGTIMAVPAPAGWPTRASADYVRHAVVDPWFDVVPDRLDALLRTGSPTPEKIERLESDAWSSGRALYVFLPRQVWAYDQYNGYFQPGALQSLIEQLNHRAGWSKVIDDADTLAYEYDG
jgi:hypothetical protein